MLTAVPAALAERRQRLTSLSWFMRPPMSLDAYLKLLDWTGRQVRAAASGSSQRGVIPSDLQPIVDRPRIVGDAWLDSVRLFGRWLHRALEQRRKRSMRRCLCCRNALVLWHRHMPPGVFLIRRA